MSILLEIIIQKHFSLHPASRAFLLLARFWRSRERLCMNRVRSLLSMRSMLPGYSFEPRPNMPNRRALAAICREIYFARCSMSSAGCTCSTPERKSVRGPTKTLGSPQTPVKLGIRKRKDEKDSCCLCCGINLYGAGSTYNLTSHESLAKKIAQLVNLVSIDVESQSCRVCKPCFRRVESLDKKSSVLLLDLQEFRSKFNRNNPKGSNLSQQCETTPDAFLKRSAKTSPPLQRKRSKVCGKLFENDVDDPDLLTEPLAAEDKSTRNDQTALVEVSVQSLKLLLKSFGCEVFWFLP